MDRHRSPEEIFGPLIEHKQDFRPANDLPLTQRHRFKILLPPITPQHRRPATSSKVFWAPVISACCSARQAQEKVW